MFFKNLREKFEQLNLKTRLVIIVLAVGLVPLTVATFFNLSKSTSNLRVSAFEKLESVRGSKNKSISRYLTSVSNLMMTLSHNKMTIDAANDYIKAFSSETKIASSDEVGKLRNYYEKEFAVEYNKKSEKSVDAGKILDQLSDRKIFSISLYC